jgi:thioredoxin 1
VSLAVLLLGAGCDDDPTTPVTPTPDGSSVVVLTSASFQSQVLANPGAAMVEFYSPTCPHCVSMTAVVEQLAQDFAGRAVVGKVDVTVERGLLDAHGIELVPTFVFFKAGREVGRFVGTTSRSDLSTRLEAAIAAP